MNGYSMISGKELIHCFTEHVSSCELNSIPSEFRSTLDIFFQIIKENCRLSISILKGPENTVIRFADSGFKTENTAFEKIDKRNITPD